MNLQRFRKPLIFGVPLVVTIVAGVYLLRLVPLFSAIVMGFGIAGTVQFTLYENRGLSERLMYQMSGHSWSNLSWFLTGLMIAALTGAVFIEEGLVRRLCGFIAPFIIGAGIRAIFYSVELDKEDQKMRGNAE